MPECKNIEKQKKNLTINTVDNTGITVTVFIYSMPNIRVSILAPYFPDGSSKSVQRI